MTVKRPKGVRCPRCGESARDEFFPFCSARCRLIDLARWIDGEYRMPGEDVADEDIGPASQPGEKVIH
jgi:endogenous inhibitor of DNA gyrase (YacG/DUF329 family)